MIGTTYREYDEMLVEQAEVVMNRENGTMTRRIWILITMLVVGGMVDRGLGQGSLTPPGAPAAMMKTLDQLEPRVPIGTAPFIISQPGAYYVTTNLAHGGGTAIVVASDDVTLDLGGFTVWGETGITFSSDPRNVVIRNGTIKGSASVAMRTDGATGCRFENLHFESAFSDGLVYLLGEGNTLEDCRVSSSVHHDDILSISGRNHVIRNCNIRSSVTSGNGIMLNAASGCVVENCTVKGGGSGVTIYSFSYPSGCTGNVVRACTINGTTLAGITLIKASGSRVEGNTCSGGSVGIDATGARENFILNNVCQGNATNFNLGTMNTFVAVDGLAASTPRWPLSGTNLNLTTAGEYYLSGDMVIGNGIISGNDITLDLNGFTITSDVTAIKITGDRVTVRNGSIVAWALGVNVHNAVDVSLEDLDVSGALDDGGISISSDSLEQPCRDVTVEDCQVVASTTAISIGLTRNVTVKGCNLKAMIPLSIGTSSGTLVSDCTLKSDGMGYASIQMTQCIDARLQRNTCHTAQWGIRTLTSTNSIVMGNMTFGCSTNYALGATDIYGVITTNREITVSHELANFSF